MTLIKPKVSRKDGKQRTGRGFSREELKKAESNLQEALRFGIPVDTKRKTAHEDNIEAVKAFMHERKAASKRQKPRGKSKG